MRRTKEQAAVTKETILRAAEELFVTKGYDAVSLDQIAEAAGVKRGAVHFHFVNKPGLLLAICACEPMPMQELVERLEKDPQSTKPLEGLLEIAEATLREFHANPGKSAILRALLTVVLTLPVEDTDVEVLAFERRFFDLTLEIFEAAEARGQLAAGWTGRTGAVAFHSMVTGLIFGSAVGRADLELDPEGIAALRGFVAALARAPLAIGA